MDNFCRIAMIMEQVLYRNDGMPFREKDGLVDQRKLPRKWKPAASLLTQYV